MVSRRFAWMLGMFLGLSWLAVPALGLANTLAGSPRVGPPTTVTRVTGSQFGPNGEVDIYFDKANLARATTDASGNFAARLVVPKSALPGAHWITAVLRAGGGTAQVAFTVRTDWPQFRFDPAHHGANPYENLLGTANAAKLGVRWSAAVGANNYTSPAVADGRLYIASANGGLNAFDSANGRRLWRVSTGSRVFFTNACPAVADGRVFLWNDEIPTSPGAPGGLFAFRAADGRPLWKKLSGASGSSPTVANGVVYYDSNVSNSGSVNAVRAADGTSLWSHREGGVYYGAPAVVGKVVYVASTALGGGGNLYAIDAATGKNIWKTFVDISFGTDSAPAVANGVAYIGAADGGLHAFAAADGKPLWTSRTGGSIQSSPAVANRVVYVGSSDGNLYAFQALDGLPLWRQATGAAIYSSPAVANRVVYIGSGDGGFYAFKAADGGFLWSYATGRPVGASPVVVDGRLFGASGNGKVYAFGLAPKTLAAVPAAAQPDPEALVPDPLISAE